MVPLLALATFVVFLVADYFVLKSQKKEHPAFATFQVFNKSSLAIPLHYLLSKGHVWLKAMREGEVKIGIDEFILKAFKKIQLVNFAAEGSLVKKGDVLFSGKIGDNLINFYSPIDGKVAQINKNITEKNIENPYEDDWGMILSPAPSTLEAAALKTTEKSVQWLESELRRLKDFLSVHTSDPELAGLTMADGGNIVEGIAGNFNEKTLQAFEKEFLSL
jgi:glycine cleavage system H protein